ncbi:MAG: hypothetical protein KC912_21530 [Proteobacteria bacterium]|nr:hypothetical protein [Pseudomonadota bacterium]
MIRLGLLLLASTPAWGRDLHVGPNDTYPTIAAAVVDLQTEGDRILVTEGTYEESVTLTDKNATFVAVGPVTWRGAGSGPNVTLVTINEQVETVRFEGFTFEAVGGHRVITAGANVEIADSDLFGGSVSQSNGGQVFSSRGLTTENSTFTGPTFAIVGGLLYSVGNLTIRDSQLWDGTADKEGGAASSKGTIYVEGSTFQGNTASAGGALMIGAGGTIYDSLFVDNTARTGGHVYGGSVVAGSTFRQGTADRGVGIYSDTLEIVADSTFEDNADVVTATRVQTQFIRTLHCLTSAQTAITVPSAKDVFLYNVQSSGPGLLVHGQSGVIQMRHVYAAGQGPVVLTEADVFARVSASIFDTVDPPIEVVSAGSFSVNWFPNGAPLAIGPQAFDITNVIGEPTGLVGDPCAGGLSYEGRPAVMDTVTTYMLPTDFPAVDWDESVADAGPFGGIFADADLWVDVDGDGWPLNLDCDDDDPARAPTLPEICGDAVDNDCDPRTDASATHSYYPDADGDGYGALLRAPIIACDPGPAHVMNSDDCDDSDADAFPFRLDLCDGVDSNCDTVIDDGFTENAYYLTNADGDVAGDGTPTMGCFGGAPQGGDCDDAQDGVAQFLHNVGMADEDADLYVAPRRPASILYPQCAEPTGIDCDDQDRLINPGRLDGCDEIDNDCDGLIDEDAGSAASGFLDDDGDGFGSVAWNGCAGHPNFTATGGDCDDANPFVFPGRDDVCNGFDDDCDGTADNNTDFMPGWFEDADGDGATVEVGKFCEAPTVTATLTNGPRDCDDTEAAASPDQDEVCGDSIDNDCDGIVDEDPNGVPWWEDADQDGFTVELPLVLCAGVTPTGFWQQTTTSTWDCDDTVAAVWPGADEICDDIDNDCDDSIDEAGGFEAYADIDVDGLGGALLPGNYCTLPTGAVAVGGDCDDNDVNVGVGPDYYRDADGDGVGGTEVIAACDDPGAGWTSVSGDCVDSDATAFPGAEEICNNRDDDCDTTVDEDLDTQAYYGDADGDGWGGALIQACGPGAAVSGLQGDCDDSDAAVYPTAFDACEDGFDANCDGVDPACDATDSDGDGFCEGGCSEGLPGDCNDDVGGTNPWALESCDAIDNDCDGLIDDGLTWDNDLDGFTAVGSCTGSADDCNDWLGSIFVGASEACNGMDDDCDELLDEGLLIDADGDGFPAAGACLSFDAVDCDDTDAAVYPGATETNNGTDDDCDGAVDEPSDGDDADGDGYCEGPTCTDSSILPGDCDDTDPGIHPGAIDLDDGIDNDCDGTVDDGPSRDADRDRDGFTVDQGDCNDLNPHVHPGAAELCNGLDDNCDGLVAVTEFDIDQDGLRACEGDCDDYNDEVRPGLAENCADSLDNNCDGLINEDADADQDGFTTCMGDCVDYDPAINPAAPEEACNEVDDNCDGIIDEGLDRDGDGWIACLVVNDDGCIPEPVECDCDDTNRFVAPWLPEICGDGLDNNCDGAIDNDDDGDGDGWTTCEGDCRDDDPFVSPGAPEVCDDIDNDCDFQVDETFDRDGDGWRTCAGDCDDDSVDVYPLNPEECDLLDNDCSGVVDDPWPDLDEDGYSECDVTPDCAEGNAQVGPDVAEQCENGFDDDCDGLADWDDPDCDVSVFPSYCGGCSASTGPTGWLFLPLLLVFRRRRV